MSDPEAGSSPAGHGEWGRRASQEAPRDNVMMERVRAAGPNSAQARYLRGVLLSDARGQLTLLHRTNRLLARVQSMLHITLPPPPSDWQDSAAGLIFVSVEQSIDPFFATAVFGDTGSRWDPNGRASVRTYFANRCLMTFKDLYLKDHENRGTGEILCPEIPVENDETTLLFPYLAAPEDPESRAVDADQIRRIGQTITPQEAHIILGKYSGKSHQEIGRDLNKSDEAVSSSLQRLRRRIGC